MNLQKPWNADPFSYQVVGTDLYIRTCSTGQADIQLLWDYIREDYNLFRRLNRRFWDDHLDFNKALVHARRKRKENPSFEEKTRFLLHDFLI